MKRLREVLLGVMLVGLGVYGGSGGTLSAGATTTENAGNHVGTGTVTITDDDNGQALFTLTGMKPSDPPEVACIVTSYTGSLPAEVRLFGTASGALAPYATVEVTRGTAPSAPDGSCDTFDADQTDTGQGPGVIYRGSLAAFPTDSATALVDPDTWSSTDSHAYRFAISVVNDPNAQGLSATAGFTWEARNQ